jgi:hypothetical protein
MSMHYFHARVGLIQVQQKSHRDTSCRTYIFASSGICGPHSAFRCVRGVKHRPTIFYARVGPVWVPQKVHGTRYVEHVFLHPEGSVGHVVQSSASRVQNMDALFFMLGWSDTKLTKACRDTLRQPCIFAFSGICGSHSAFRCVWGAKHQCTIFHAQGPVWFP